MMKKYLYILLLLVFVTGCSKESENTILPDIVFFNVIDYYGSENEQAITFYDSKGNHYTSTDSYVCHLDLQSLVTEYGEGKLVDKINYHTSCDIDELLDNYSKLCELGKDGCQIVYPNITLDYEADRFEWYGLYYDQNGKLDHVLLHVRNAEGDHFADDERANEIYRWYLSTFSK